MRLVDRYIREADEQMVLISNKYAGLAALYGASEDELHEQYVDLILGLSEKYGVCLTPWADAE